MRHPLLIGIFGTFLACSNPEPPPDADPPDSSAPTFKDNGDSGRTFSVMPDSGQRDDAGATLDAGRNPTFDECAASTTEARLTPANLLFLVDRSGSMNCVPPDGDAAEAQLCLTDPRKRGDGESKWEVTRDALSSALAALSSRENVSAGLSLFPVPETQCDVATEPNVAVADLDPAQLELIDQALFSVMPDGDTPIAGGSILSYSHLATALKERKLKGNTFLVLFTDGSETCKRGELQKLIDRDVPTALSGFGIRTFVIGAPGSEEARSVLSQIAYFGGTASSANCDRGTNDETANCHLDMTRTENFQQDLAEALRTITETKALACEFDLPRNPSGGGVNLAEVNVTFSPSPQAEAETIAKHDGEEGSCDGQDEGWTYSTDRDKVLLCGSNCEAVQRSNEGQVGIVLGCPSVTIKMAK